MQTESYEMAEIKLLCPNLYDYIQNNLPTFIEGLWDSETVHISLDNDEFKVQWNQRGTIQDIHFNPNSAWIGFDEVSEEIAQEVQNLF